MKRLKLGSRVLLPILVLLSVTLLACGDDEAATPAPVVPATPAVEAPRSLTDSERGVIDQFSEDLQEIRAARDELHQGFDAWRAELSECHPSSARETFQELTSSIIGITQQTTKLPRTASTRELADLLIPAAEAEEAAFRQLRDRWQPGNVSLLELAELRGNEAVRAQKSAEDRSLELQEEFEEGATEGEVADMEEYSEVFDDLVDAWEDYHDSYLDLLKAEPRLKTGERIAQYELLVQQLEGIVSLTSELSVPIGNDDIEEIVEQLQEMAEDELAALSRMTESLAEVAEPPAEDAATTAAASTVATTAAASTVATTAAAPTVATTAAAPTVATPTPPPGDQPEGGETTAGEEAPAEAPVKPVKLLPPDEDLAETYAASVKGLEEIDLQIEEIIEDKSAEFLADVQDFNAEYRGLVREWDTFHRDFNAWRESDGDCNRLSVLGVLDEFSQDAGALGRQVRDLPQAGFLLPIYTLLTEAAERDEAAMRTVYSSWRPFAVDVFKAVDEERVASDRLWRRAGIALQELRDRP